MTTDVGAGRIVAPRVDERLDLLSCQIEEIAADLRRQRESRAQWEELAQTLVPVSRGAFDVASRELEDLAEDVSVDDAVRLLRTIARSLPQLERMLAQVQGVSDLGSELTSLSGAGFAKAADVLAEAERRGYFAVARGGRTVLDRVVTSYADEDFELAADRLAQVLSAVRADLATIHEPPSTLGLVKQLRDPQTRLGLARALALVRALGDQPVGATDPNEI